jgi:hypothetical protein
LLATAVLAQEGADPVWTGEAIMTMNDRALHAEALAGRGGEIIATLKKLAVSRRERR